MFGALLSDGVRATFPCLIFLVGCGVTGGPEPVPPIDLVSLSADGPNEVLSYTDFPDVPEFGAATIYYPADTVGPLGGVAISPGYTEVQAHVSWWGPRLASHGYAVLVLDTNEPRDFPDVRANALVAGVNVLRSEGTREGSPLAGRIDPAKMAVMGHSMGGGGALLAANEHSDQIRASIPFTPWEPESTLEGITAPTLILAGELDGIAEVAEHAWRHFTLIPDATPKVYLEMAGGNHYIADTTRGTDLATMGRYALAWLKLYVDGDERYREFLYGVRTAEDEAKFSRYVADP
jgi:dienelactone hydrolase